MAQSAAANAGNDITPLLTRIYPHDDVLSASPLPGGRSNTMYRVRLSKAGDVVLRIFARGAAESPREIEVLQRLRGRVAVPELIAFGVTPGSTAFAVYRYVEGVTFKDFKKTAGSVAIAQASFSAGFALAELGKVRPVDATPFRVEPDCPGWGAAALPEFLAACARDPILRRRTGSETAAGLLSVVERWSTQLEDCSRRDGLVHGDFSHSNVVLDGASGTWSVAAILDWEFACGGSPLFDVGHFLRYENVQRYRLEPAFSDGFAANGGRLPEDWRRLARIVDLAALAAGLTKAHLAPTAQAELLELLRTTLRVCPSP